MAKTPSNDRKTLGSLMRPMNPGFTKGAKDRDPILFPGEGVHDISDLAKRNNASVTSVEARSMNKNFPGHGNTETEPHTRSSVLNPAIDDSVYQQHNEAGGDGATAAEVNFANLSGGTPAGATLGSFFGAEKLTEVIAKPGHISDARDGNTANRINLDSSGAPLDDGSAKLVSTIEGVLHDTNKYSPKEGSSPFIEEGEFTKGMYSIQSGELGTFDKDKAKVSIEKLTSRAEKLMLVAGGHGADYNPDGQDFDWLAVKPSYTQLGSGKINVVDFNINVENHDAPGKSKQLLNRPEGEEPIESYGQMNTYAEPFDGPMPAGMMMTTLYGMAAIATIGGIMEALVDNKNADSDLPDVMNPHTLAMGQARTDKAGAGDDIFALFLEMFGIARTESNWATAVVRGMMAFYGIGKPLQDITPLDLVGSVLQNIFLSPGYYAVITKQVVRDTEQVQQAVADMGNVGGFLGSASQVLKVVEATFTSTTFKFVNTMAALGDISYKELFNRGSHAHAGARILKREDEKTHNISALSRMSSPARFKSSTDHRTKSVLSLTSFGSILLHNPLTNASSAAIGNSIQDDGTSDKTLAKASNHWITRKESKARISQELREAAETALNSEYMPFYIHDVRTNEIVAMPAFLSSVSDSFTANYTNTQGYGRTDPVMIYNNTTRQIDMTYKLAAMSEDDHSYMWYIINRLTAMLYPQRSAGKIRKYAKGEKHFTQPFSQVPTASPLVRIRVGELISSNYHVKNFARLFGNETSGIKLDDTQKSIASRKEVLYKDAERNFKSNLDDIKTGTVVNIKHLGTFYHGNALIYNLRAETATITAVNSVNGKKHVFFKISKNDLGGLSWHNALRRLDKNILEKAKKDGRLSGRVKLSTARARMHPSQKDKDAWVEEQYKKIYHKDMSDNPRIKHFMNPKDNAYVRSFESAGGKGLAGFITQMSLSYDGAPWSITTGQRAPQFVEIQLSFTPIHDLPLGLDADGLMLAPSHPVGMAALGEADEWENDKAIKSNEVLVAQHAETPSVATPDDPAKSTAPSTSGVGSITV